MRGDALLAEFECAFDEVSASLAFQANHADCLAFLSTTLSFAGRPEEGLHAIRSAIERNPYHPGYYLVMLGRAQFMLDYYPEAIKVLDRLVNAMPEFTAGHTLLAATYTAVDRDANAKEEIQEILKITPGYTLATISHVNLYKKPKGLELYARLLHRAGLPE